LLKFGEKMKKIMTILTIGMLAVFLLSMFAPALAAKPTQIDDAWFVIPIFVKSNISQYPISIVPDKVWTSDDGTILHAQSSQIATYLAHTPKVVPPGTIRWGTVQAVSNFVFDTTTNTGTLTMKLTLTLTSASSSNPTLYPAANYPNTYGFGTLEGTLVAEVTSLNPYVDTAALKCPVPGAGQGHFVATHGTGDFANAKLSADVTLEPVAVDKGTVHLGEEFIFIGHHFDHEYNEGTLTFHK
jgi:hypothetical protein